jgi:hypothetical protein
MTLLSSSFLFRFLMLFCFFFCVCFTFVHAALLSSI